MGRRKKGRDISGWLVVDKPAGISSAAVVNKVKWAFDEGQVDFTVLLGSSRILLMERVKETLAGRAYLYDLWPLMASELMFDAGQGQTARGRAPHASATNHDRCHRRSRRCANLLVVGVEVLLCAREQQRHVVGQQHGSRSW